MTTALCLAAFLLLFSMLLWPRRLDVQRVVDGDSLEAVYRRRNVRIRIAGYDAPEYHQSAGREARTVLAAIVEAQTLRLWLPSIDRYGRLVGTCFAGPVPLSWRMVLAGYGWPDGKISFILSLLPRLLRCGLWAGRNPVHPALWRRANSSQRRADI